MFLSIIAAGGRIPSWPFVLSIVVFAGVAAILAGINAWAKKYSSENRPSES